MAAPEDPGGEDGSQEHLLPTAAGEKAAVFLPESNHSQQCLHNFGGDANVISSTLCAISAMALQKPQMILTMIAFLLTGIATKNM